MAHHALTSASTITACYPLMQYVLQHVLPLYSSTSAGATTYPDDLIRAFAIAQPPLADVLCQVVDTLRDAVSLMPAGGGVRGWPQPVGSWKRENLRLADTLRLFLDVLVAARSPEPLTDQELDELRRRGEELMLSVAGTRPAYMEPAVLREHWMFVREIEPALKRLREQGGVATAESWYAWLI